MRATRSLFDAMDEACDVFTCMMMIDTAEAHLLVTARAYDAVAVHDAANALVEGGAAIATPHTDLHFVDGIVHDTGPADRAHAAPA